MLFIMNIFCNIVILLQSIEIGILLLLVTLIAFIIVNKVWFILCMYTGTNESIIFYFLLFQ